MTRLRAAFRHGRLLRGGRPAILLVLLVAESLAGQQPEASLTVSVEPDRSGWVYRRGEPVRFRVAVLSAGRPVPDARVRYEAGPEQMPARARGVLELRDGRAEIDAGTMREPGFLRATVVAEVDGREHRALATAAFDPQEIAPTTTMPSDFTAFWDEAIRRARAVPLEARMVPVPEQSTPEISVYHVSFQNDRAGGRIYGMLAMPSKPGRYPAVLAVPGAGVRPYTANTELAARGLIHLTIGIHGIPVDLDAELYQSLGQGALAGYPRYGLEDRDRYYYRRVILGAIRAGDFLFDLPQFDGDRYAVHGGSQGGALAIITAALDPRVKRLASVFPALSDHTGYLHGRAGGWPHLFAAVSRGAQADPREVETSRYYDVVNFARLLRVPGFYTWGYNDVVCPPTSMYAAYNVITAPRSLFVVPEAGHRQTPEQGDRVNDWLTQPWVDRP